MSWVWFCPVACFLIESEIKMRNKTLRSGKFTGTSRSTYAVKVWKQASLQSRYNPATRRLGPCDLKPVLTIGWKVISWPKWHYRVSASWFQTIQNDAYLCSCFLDPGSLAHFFRLLLYSLGDTRTCSSRWNQSNILQIAQSKKGNHSAHAHSPAFDFSPRLGGEPFGDESEASFEGVTGIWELFWDMRFAWDVLKPKGPEALKLNPIHGDGNQADTRPHHPP
jgi:hypothetical protein